MFVVFRARDPFHQLLKEGFQFRNLSLCSSQFQFSLLMPFRFNLQVQGFYSLSTLYNFHTEIQDEQVFLSVDRFPQKKFEDLLLLLLLLLLKFDPYMLLDRV